MKHYVPVLMTARERASLLAEFDGTVLRPGGTAAPHLTPLSAKFPEPAPVGFVDYVKAALAAAGMRMAEAGVRR